MGGTRKLEVFLPRVLHKWKGFAPWCEYARGGRQCGGSWAGAAGGMAGWRAAVLGVPALRHAVAQRLLDHGLSMKQVGDYLGHRSVAATSVYAKVRLDALREVAAIDLQGLA